MRAFTDSSQEDMTNHFFQSASGSLASTFGDFHTPSQGSAMKFLDAGSTAEGSSTKRSSLSPVKPVGFGFSAPSRVSAPLVQGPVFSTDTDTDPNTSETRFVCFDLIPEQWTQDSAEGCVLNRALEYTSLIGLIDTAVGSPSEDPGFTLFETVLTTVAFNFISHHEYFGADHTKVAPCLICPPRWSVRIAVIPLTTARLSRALVQTGLIGLFDDCCFRRMELNPQHLQPNTTHGPSDPQRTLPTLASALITIFPFGASGPYVQALRVHNEERNARCRGRHRRRDTSFFESWIQEFRAGFLFGDVISNAMLVAELVEN
ncbi:hypothetical protein D6D26_09447 [Aureobasidium pullulans]|nr:hypothetical protein D6D26_09447 [Aureobasidium pullulans]